VLKRIGLILWQRSKNLTWSRMKELKEKFDKVEKITIQNTYDVAYLKSVK
jgi:hypothetical protein